MHKYCGRLSDFATDKKSVSLFVEDLDFLLGQHFGDLVSKAVSEELHELNEELHENEVDKDLRKKEIIRYKEEIAYLEEENIRLVKQAEELRNRDLETEIKELKMQKEKLIEIVRSFKTLADSI